MKGILPEVRVSRMGIRKKMLLMVCHCYIYDDGCDSCYFYVDE